MKNILVKKNQSWVQPGPGVKDSEGVSDTSLPVDF